MDHIAVLHFIVLTFGSEPSVLFCSRQFSFTFHELIVRDRLGSDESFLKIRMDLSGCLWSKRASFDRPGSCLVFSCGQEGDEVKKGVG